MAKIDLLELYPEFKSGMHEKETCFIEVPDNIADDYVENLTPDAAYVHISYEREELAYNRRKFRYKAHYSLDAEMDRKYSAEQLEFMSDNCVPSAEDIYIDKFTRESLYKAISKLSDKQFKRIYEYYFLDKSKAEIAESEGVTEFVIRQSIKLGIKCLNLRLKV